RSRRRRPRLRARPESRARARPTLSRTMVRTAGGVRPADADGPAPRHSSDFRLPPRTDSRKSTWSQTSERTTEASMPAETSDHLPVMIRVAATKADLRQVAAVRAEAADSHVRTATNALETWDQRSNAMLLLAESRHNGQALGSLRVLASE